ncbi:eukaryotic translation initiation factor 2-alpha kinase-like isoform X3 [Planococcus citri]|uniref:eukaryotic translation initiation factor 2-alpha kinase-like isoform X3 n=1 Tax=Planococcus citri TaxID=170843 RepID=UPI0031F7DB57
MLNFSFYFDEDTNIVDICNERLLNRRLILVSTLDGRLSALDLVKDGSLRWSIDTEPGPLLSSTIHQVEQSEDSRSYRLIPSLSGGLYKFDGAFVEPMPLNVDHLLKSYSDDDITGGKEVRSYAVEIESGKILYECSMKECSNWTENNYLNYDIMLVRRETQIVRAIEPQTRIEKWNYSVGLHNVVLTRGGLPECSFNQEPINIDIKVDVPKGLLSVVNKSEPSKILWQYQFESPVANVWHLVGNRLENVDLFRAAESAPEEIRTQSNPSIYIGSHNKQWYIQESEPFHRNYLLQDNPLLTMKKFKFVPAVDSDSDRNLPQITDGSGHNSSTSLTKLYDVEAVNGKGYYSYCEDKKSECRAERKPPNVSTSKSFWWKESFIVLIITFVLFKYLNPCPNLFSFSITETIKSFLNRLRRVEVPKESAMEATTGHQDPGPSIAFTSTFSEYEIKSFKSRYLDDFEPIHCLGKGGFGVVFQARNKIDDCHYAIKRITLPNREEARERVMREVKALAKLEHQHIVRYFQAWQECPPVGWQEEQDKLWKNKTKDEYLSSEPEDCLSSEMDGLSTTNTSPSHFNNNVFDQTTNSCDLNLNGFQNGDAAVPSTSDKSNNSFVEFRTSSQSENSDAQLKSNRQSDPVCCTAATYEIKRRKSLQKTSKVYLYIQMQLCQKSSLKEWLCDNPNRDMNTILNIFDQIVQAVEYVHLQGLIHRDLKPSNIFFSPDGQIKVGDFGLVTEMIEDSEYSVEKTKPTYFDESRTANVGTELYMSPEQVHGKPYNHKVDIYSLGIIFFELLVPFSTEMERYKTLTALRSNKFPQDFPDKYENEFNLLSMMLANVPDARPTTFGIKARPPLSTFRTFEGSNLQDWHFELPTKNNSNILRKSSSESA